MVADELMQRAVDERAKITISGHWGVAGRPVLGSSGVARCVAIPLLQAKRGVFVLTGHSIE